MSQGMNVTVHEAIHAYIAEPDYEKNVREALAKVAARGENALLGDVVRALGVFLLSKSTREVLANNDPQAVKQALKAIGLSV